MSDMYTNKKLVVVTADLSLQESLSAYFKLKSYDVFVYSDADLALQAAQNQDLHWDLLVADLELEQMSELQFAESLKTSKPDLPVIFVAATHLVERAVQTIRYGAYDCIFKPIHLPQLLVAVEKALYFSKAGNKEANAGSDMDFTFKIDKSLPSLQSVIQKYIEFAVQRNGGAKDRTAREIGIDRKTLYKKIKMADASVVQ